jgi:hypothetical protein
MSKTKLFVSLNEAYHSMLNEKLEMSITSPDQGRPGVIEIVKDDKVVWSQEFKTTSEKGAVEANAKAEMKKMEMGEAKDCKPDFPDVDKDGDKEECMGEGNDAYNRLAKYVDLWFKTYEPGTAPAGDEWENFMADHSDEMSDDKGLPLMVRGGIMWANAKAKALSKK